MRRVLLTGASGFVGRAALSHLRARGFEIHGIGRTIIDGVDVFHQVDLLATSEVAAALSRVRPSHLLHLAWYAEPGVYWRSPKNLDWVAASLALVRSFAEAGGTRAVVAGTCAEYQWGPARFLEHESPCAPSTLYGTAKDATRRILEAYAPTAALSFAWGRIFYLYGPAEKPGRLVSDAVCSLLRGEHFSTSEGRQRRDFSHVGDIAGAFAALLDSQVEGPVNIGSGDARPVRMLIERLATTIGRPELVGFGERVLPPTEPASVEADVARLREEVGFTPRYDLESGLDETVAWWRQTLGLS